MVAEKLFHFQPPTTSDSEEGSDDTAPDDDAAPNEPAPPPPRIEDRKSSPTTAEEPIYVNWPISTCHESFSEETEDYYLNDNIRIPTPTPRQ